MNYSKKTKKELINIINKFEQQSPNSNNQPLFTILDSKYSLKTLFEDAPLGYYVSEIDGTFIDGNKAAEKIVGYKKEELINKDFLKLNLLPDDQKQKATSLLSKSRRGRSTGPDELVLRKKDKSLVTIEISTFPTLLDNTKVILGVIQDISARIRQEKELREAELKYRSIAQSSIDAIITASNKGKVIAWNKGAEKIFGYNQNEILGKDLTTIIPHEYQIDHMGAFNSAGRHDNPLRAGGTVEITGFRKNGSIVPIELSVTRSGTQEYSSFTSIIRDISERKAAELKQKKYTEDLAFLSKSAMQFVGLKHDDNVLQIIGDQLSELIPNSIIAVSLYNEALHSLKIDQVSGLGKYTNVIASMIGRNPVGIELPVSKGVMNILSKGKLIENNKGISTITGNQVSAEAAIMINKTLGIKNIYSIGLLLEKQLLASVNIVLLKEKELANKSIINTYLHEAGVALQRQQVILELQKKSIQQEYLLKTAKQMTASLDLNKVLHEIAHQATTLLNCYGVSLYTIDESGKILNPVLAIEPPYEEEILSAPLDIDNSLSGKAVKAKKGMIFNDATQDPDAYHVPGTPQDEDEHVLVSPFVINNKVIGTFTINRFKNKFTQNDLQIAEAIANYAATALNNAQIHEEIQHEVMERKHAEKVQKALYQISEAANRADSMDALYKSIHKIIEQLLYAKNLYISIYDDESDMLTFPYFIDKYVKKRAPRKLDDSITAKVVRSGQPILKSDEKYNKLVDPSHTTLHGQPSLDWLGVPLKTSNQTIGALVIQTYSKGHRYTKTDLKLLNYVSSQIALAINRKQSEDRFQESIQEILLLEEINRSTQLGKNANEIIQEITTLFGEIGPIQHTWYFSYNPDENKLKLENSEGKSDINILINKLPGIDKNNFAPNLKFNYKFNQIIKTGVGFITSNANEISDLLAEFTPRKANKTKILPIIRNSQVKSLGSIPLHSDGKPLGLIIFSSDQLVRNQEFERLCRITNQVSRVIDRTYSQDQLQILSAAVQQSPAPVLITDPDGNIEYTNPKFLEITGYSEKEIIGQNPRILNAGVQSVEFYEDLWSTLKSGHDWHGQFCNKKKNGELFWETASISPILDDKENITHFIAVKEDITDSKQAEEALRESEERFRAIFEDSLDAIYISDSDGNIQTLNKAGMGMFGLNSNDMGKINAKDFYLNSEERLKFVEENKKFGFVKEFQTKLIGKNGKIMDCVINSTTRISDGDGELYQGIIRDVSSQVKARNELESALDKATNADKVKSLFLANMSHEIRTPLNSILGFTDLIQSEIDRYLNKDQRNHFEIVQHSGKRLLRTVHEVLDISQIEAGTFNIKPERFELLPVINRIVEEFNQDAISKGITVTLNSTLKSTIIESDKYCITEAISNLLDNAIKYTQKGGINISVTRKNNRLNLNLQDSGIGMSDKYLHNMFEPFSQESTGYTKKFQGVGLGLALSKRYADLNNVKIDFTSKKGVGTIVSLTFPPLAKATTRISITSDNSPKIKDAIQVQLQNQKILLVEDDPGSRKLVELIINQKYRHAWAESVIGAKKQLKKEPIDIVLLDLSLYGDEDGLDLVRWMRKTKQWKDCPVIALTAHALTTDRELCIESGCNDYLTKPLNKTIFLEKINKYLKE